MHRKWRTNSWFLRRNYSQAHGLVLVKDFLAENSVTTLEHLLYLLTCLQLIVYLFPRLKSALKVTTRL
jgi:hypothetical protein